MKKFNKYSWTINKRNSKNKARLSLIRKIKKLLKAELAKKKKVLKHQWNKDTDYIEHSEWMSNNTLTEPLHERPFACKVR